MSGLSYSTGYDMPVAGTGATTWAIYEQGSRDQMRARKHKKCVAARDWKGANECSTLIRALDYAAAALRDVEDEFARVAGVKS